MEAERSPAVQKPRKFVNRTATSLAPSLRKTQRHIQKYLYKAVGYTFSTFHVTAHTDGARATAALSNSLLTPTRSKRLAPTMSSLR